METVFGFTDTETTGTLKNHQEQILDYALVFVEKGSIIELINQEIILKKNILPNPEALLVNNINPYSKNWQQKAISENKAVNLFIEQVEKYKKQNKKVILVAYNAEFDENMYKEMFERNGKDFNQLVVTMFDPLPLARLLLKQGKLKTVEMQGFKGETYQSAKLEHVYNGLGYSSAEVKAHNALEDTKMLATVTNKLYLLYAGKELSEIVSNPHDYKMGEVKTIQYLNNETMSLEEKMILVVSNDLENQTLHVIDADLAADSSKSLKNTILKLEYCQVFDEMFFDVEKTKKMLMNFYNSREKEISELKFENYPKKINIENFNQVEELSQKCLSDLEFVKTIEKDEDQIELIEKAERLAYSSQNKGWTLEIYGEKYKNEIKYVFDNSEYQIGLNPLEGSFIVLKNNKEILNSKKKTEVLALLEEEKVITKATDEYKKMNALLIPVKQFENKKHILKIKEEFNKFKNDVFNGANKNHKEIFTDYLSFLKQNYPSFFNDVSVPSYKLNLSNLIKK